tara:strand:- start:1671 stop:2018 length:348 start_codon:yes stop_codon:yes gene_type:complete
MAYSNDAQKRGRSRRVGSYQQGQNNPESTGQPVQGQNNKPLFKDGNKAPAPNKMGSYTEKQPPNQPNKAGLPAGGGSLINEDTSEGTFKTKVSECVWQGILNGDTFKDAKKKCNG